MIGKTLIVRRFPVWLSAAVLGLAPRAYGQCVEHWLPGSSVADTDGRVFAVTKWDPDQGGPLAELLVVAGQFSRMGNATTWNIAAWDGRSWRAIASANSMSFDGKREMLALEANSVVFTISPTSF